jgi:lipopolysaccharide export system protein LptC|tara:strand:+ start:1871 stop:2461 length:591 start_codon:yes stop_codon:yes gene_type:complete
LTSRAIILSCIIIAIALVTNWFLDDSSPLPDTDDLTRNDADLYMLDATIKQFSDDGKLHHELSAQRFTHFPLTDWTTLVSPNIVLFSDDAIPWAITAEQGRMITNSSFREEVVELWGNVLAVKQNPDGSFVNIQTQELTVYPERDYAETDKKVYIDDNSGRTTAAAMQASFVEGKFSFSSGALDRVRTLFIPAHRR